MYDVAIIGTGPAGVSAALTLRANGKKVIWFGSRSLSHKIRKAETILNYPGLSAVSGEDMKDSFLRQIDALGIEITEKTVTGVYTMGRYFGILCNTESFEAKAVIVATGVSGVKPIAGELELLGRGVSYCATCDGMLYRQKTIAVVSTSAEYEHEVSFLASLASKVYLIPLYQGVGVTADNICRVQGMPRAVQGERRAEHLVFDDKTLDVDGVFFLKSAISPTALVTGLEEREGHVVVDREGRTNLTGCFAAGDCTGRPYQYAKAVGEGNVAAHAAIRYLAEKE